MAKRKGAVPPKTGSTSSSADAAPRRGFSFRRVLGMVVLALLWRNFLSPSTSAAPKNSDLSFRVYENVLESCDDNCYDKILEDARKVGLDNTFWLDHEDKAEDSTLLEHLTRSIFEYHCGNVPGCGGEWWIQWRDTKSVDNTRTPLHFDKDETLMKEENRYQGPFLTCVTYLNEPSFPTVALDVKLDAYYDLVPNVTSNGTISKVYLAVPSKGGHTVFDGSLLHGALVDERFILANDAKSKPAQRFVLVISFWADGARPKDARKVDSEAKAKLRKDRITAFQKKPKNVVMKFGSQQLDSLKSAGSGFKSYNFNFRHLSLHLRSGQLAVSAVQEFIAQLCLPSPDYIAKHRPQSYELHYGSICQADLVNSKVHDMTKPKEDPSYGWQDGDGSIVKLSATERFLLRLRYRAKRMKDSMPKFSLGRFSVTSTKEYVESLIRRLAGVKK